MLSDLAISSADHEAFEAENVLTAGDTQLNRPLRGGAERIGGHHPPAKKNGEMASKSSPWVHRNPALQGPVLTLRRCRWWAWS